MATIPPKPYRRMKQQHPDLFAAVEALGEVLKGQGPIEEKNAQLIQLAAAAAIRSEGAVHSHARRALDAGASPAEVHHALLLLTSTIGFPGVMAASSWADDVMVSDEG
ncbi:MAG TPA: carboxymuconolactone decarboxylase family protein [Gammaproteobacteria bacterium]